MPRRKSKHRPLRFWMSALKDCIERRFVQVGHSFYTDKRVQSLSYSARWVLQCCADMSVGEESFTFPAVKAKQDYGIAHGTFTNAMKELREAGFIEIVASGKNLSGPTEYRFSRVWRGESAP